MKATNTGYDFLNSFNRIDQILESGDENYEELDELPNRDRLTFSNGFYAHCSAMFVDIRNSSALPSIYTIPNLAKLYRAFISEVVALMNSSQNCNELNIVGDCIWGVLALLIVKILIAYLKQLQKCPA